MNLPARRECGFSLLEVMIAIVVLSVAVLGVLALFGVATSTNLSQADHGPRATELAQAKMEQLLALSFTNTQTDTTQSPTVSTGGSGLAVGGGVDSASPVAHYVDYLDVNGNYGATSSNAYYVRQWQIVVDANAQFKTITVLARCVATTAQAGPAPSTTIASIKANL